MTISRDARITAFWTWFLEHREAFEGIDAGATCLDDLHRELGEIHEGLHFELCAGSRPKELIITAGGQSEIFALAEAVVGAAPRIAGWTFLALKPAWGASFETCYEGEVFDPDAMGFLPLESASRPGDLGIRVGVPGLASDGMERARAAVPVVLETMLGERSFATDIRHIEVVCLPSEPEAGEFLALSSLAAYIAWWKARRRRP